MATERIPGDQLLLSVQMQKCKIQAIPKLRSNLASIWSGENAAESLMLNPSKWLWKHIKSTNSDHQITFTWRKGDIRLFGMPSGPTQQATDNHLTMFLPDCNPHERSASQPDLDRMAIVHASTTFGCRSFGTDHFPIAATHERWGPGTITTLNKRSIHVSQGGGSTRGGC